eukprot:5218199-Pleurochrysis_carterae.AAC.1
MCIRDRSGSGRWQPAVARRRQSRRSARSCLAHAGSGRDEHLRAQSGEKRFACVSAGVWERGGGVGEGRSARERESGGEAACAQLTHPAHVGRGAASNIQPLSHFAVFTVPPPATARLARISPVASPTRP